MTDKLTTLLAKRTEILTILVQEWPETRQLELGRMQLKYNHLLCGMNRLNIPLSEDEESMRSEMGRLTETLVNQRRQAKEAKKALDASGFAAFQKLRDELSDVTKAIREELEGPLHVQYRHVG